MNNSTQTHTSKWNSDLSVWLSVDPLSDKYPSMSAFMYCAGNPVKFVDPDGREIWDFDEKGNFLGRTINTEYDKFRVIKVGKDGNKEVISQSEEFKAGTVKTHNQPIPNIKGKPSLLNVFEINGDDNAKAIFEMFANFTNAEWTHAKIGGEESNRNILGTQGSKSSTAVGAYLRSTNYTLREVIHNHPSNNPLPSGIMDFENKEERTLDLLGAQKYKEANNSKNAKLFIYTKTFGYSQYNENGTLEPRITKIDGKWTIKY